MGDVAGVLSTVKGLSDEEKSQVVLETIAGGSVIWLSNLKKEFEKKFGVTAAVAMAAGPAAAAAPAAAAEVQTTFDVILLPVTPDKKINVIKIVRTMTDLGLKEAKQLVDEAPKTLKTGIPKDEAEKIKKEIEAAGGGAQIK